MTSLYFDERKLVRRNYIATTRRHIFSVLAEPLHFTS